MPSTIQIRPARPEEAGAVLSLVRELAVYERLEHEMDATQEMLRAALFSAQPRVFCDLAFMEGEAIGLALWFYSFSTFRGRHGIYLEDLFVKPAFRGRGIGKALLKGLATRCVAEDLARLEWSVLDWNAPSIAFYKAQGAELMDGWTMCRVTGGVLRKLAEERT